MRGYLIKPVTFPLLFEVRGRHVKFSPLFFSRLVCRYSPSDTVCNTLALKKFIKVISYECRDEELSLLQNIQCSLPPFSLWMFSL